MVSIRAGDVRPLCAPFLVSVLTFYLSFTPLFFKHHDFSSQLNSPFHWSSTSLLPTGHFRNHLRRSTCSRCRYGTPLFPPSALSREDLLTFRHGLAAGLDIEEQIYPPLVPGLFVSGASSAHGEALLRSLLSLATLTTSTTYILYRQLSLHL